MHYICKEDTLNRKITTNNYAKQYLPSPQTKMALKNRKDAKNIKYD